MSNKDLEKFIASLLKPLDIELKKIILKDRYPIYEMKTISSKTCVYLNSINTIGIGGRSAWTLLKDVLFDICKFTVFLYLDDGLKTRFLANNPYHGVRNLDEMKIIRDLL